VKSGIISFDGTILHSNAYSLKENQQNNGQIELETAITFTLFSAVIFQSLHCTENLNIYQNSGE
jgi:hypothetical protein